MHCLRNLYWSFSNQTTLKLMKNSTKLCRSLCELSYRDSKYKNYYPLVGPSKILEEHFRRETVCWEEVEKELIDTAHDPERCKSIIFNCCLHLCAYDHGLDYYKYLLKKNENLKVQELVPVLHILSKCDTIKLQDDIVKDLFDKFRPLLEAHEVLQRPAFEVFSRFKCFWKDLVELSPKLHHLSILESLISNAFDFDDKDLGFQMFNKESESFSPKVLISFFKFCIRSAKKNSFDVSDLDFLISFANENLVRFSNVNLFPYFENLVEILNSQGEKKYFWSVTRSVVDSSSVCNNCGYKLSKKNIQNNVCKELKKAVEKDIFLKDNILMRSSMKEFMAFKAFLKSAKPYNVVLDGTNLFYSHKVNGMSLSRLIHDLKKQNQNLLVVARKHVKQHKTLSLIQPESNIFWTDNESDDDLFIIYAALHGGPNTYLFSRDLYRGYHSYFMDKPQIRKTFLSWKQSHLYSINFNKIVPPVKHALLPQKTVNEPNKMEVWHFPEILDDLSQDFRKWICLKRIPLQFKVLDEKLNNRGKKFEPLELIESEKGVGNEIRKNNNTCSTPRVSSDSKPHETLEAMLNNSTIRN